MNRDSTQSSKLELTYSILVVGVVLAAGITWFIQRDIDPPNSDPSIDSAQDYKGAVGIHEPSRLREAELNSPTETIDGEADLGSDRINAPPMVYLKDGSMGVDPLTPFDTIYNLREVFDENYQNALEGNPESMYMMSLVAANCQKVGHYQSLDELSQAELARLPSQEYALYWQDILPFVERLFPDCVYINSHKPATSGMMNLGDNPDHWASNWLTAAAEAGHVIAKLDQTLGLSISNPEQVRELLDAAVRTKNHKAMMRAHIYFRNAIQAPRRKTGLNSSENDPRNLTVELWEYLECKYNPRCNLSMRDRYLEETHYPRDVASIIAAAGRFEQRIQDPTPIDFTDYRHIDEIFNVE